MLFQLKLYQSNILYLYEIAFNHFALSNDYLIEIQIVISSFNLKTPNIYWNKVVNLICGRKFIYKFVLSNQTINYSEKYTTKSIFFNSINV